MASILRLPMPYLSLRKEPDIILFPLLFVRDGQRDHSEHYNYYSEKKVHVTPGTVKLLKALTLKGSLKLISFVSFNPKGIIGILPLDL